MSTTTMTWHETRDHYSNTYGQYPGPQIEAEIIEAFEIAPTAVTNTLEDIAGLHHAGQVTSPWGLAHARLTRQAAPIRDVTVDAGPDRAKSIDRAEAWLKHTGCQYAEQAHVEGELFGDDYGRGLLEPWADDEPLRERMLDLWKQLRPAGERVEADQAERYDAYRKHNTCADCGTVYPFANRPCHCPESRKRALQELEAKTPDEWQASAHGDDRSRWFE